MFLLFGPQARRQGERTGPESGAQQRSGTGWGQAPGRRAAARARRWRQAARRVRGRRGRAGRCVLVGQFRAPRYVAARRPSRDGRPRPQSPRPHPPPACCQWPRPAGAGSLRPRPCPALLLPLPAPPPATSVPPRPLPPPPPEHREDPRPATDPVLRNGGRCSVDRGEPGEGPEVPPSPVAFSARLPSPSRSPRRLDEPSYPRSSQRRFLSRSAQPAKLPVADPVPGRGLRRLGRGRDLRLPLSLHARRRPPPP